MHGSDSGFPIDAASEPVVIMDAGRLRVRSRDGVVTREELPALREATAVLTAAREEAARMLAEVERAGIQMQERIETEGKLWLQMREEELRTEMSVQQAAWLATLESTWISALEGCVRQICGSILSADALAGALHAGSQHFQSLAGVRVGVHPDDAEAAHRALAILPAEQSSLLRVEVDDAIPKGKCRMRGTSLEVTLALERAIAIAIGAHL